MKPFSIFVSAELLMLLLIIICPFLVTSLRTGSYFANFKSSLRIKASLTFQRFDSHVTSKILKQRYRPTSTLASSISSSPSTVVSPWVMSTYATAFEKSCQRSPYRQHYSQLWDIIRYESASSLSEDIRTSALLANAILSQCSLEEAVIDHLSNQLDTTFFPSTQLRSVFHDVLSNNRSIANALSSDLIATALHDESIPNVMSVLLFHKGFHALAAYRIANSLQNQGRFGLARHFQSIISRVFAADIHPSCHIGPGCYLSSGCDVVIGETASIGSNCLLMHGVTLGGTGKESGDRHPKVGNHVFIGAQSTVLGNIKIGDGCVINPCSVVTKPVEADTRVGGVPAKMVANTSTPYLDHKIQFLNMLLKPTDVSGNDELCCQLIGELNGLKQYISSCMHSLT